MTMENKGLVFIPDISGFSQFVHETEIDHSRLIIQELLEILINSNMIGLEISEIEGDAILFYKYGECPDLKVVFDQVERMFVEFHKNISAYDHRRFCQCKACMSVTNLTLKIISHYGEFTGYNVKNFNKLFGRDIIIAHRLLKNDIAEHEYWLITDGLLNNCRLKPLADWMKWDASIKETDEGIIPFHYTQLGELKKGIIPDIIPPEDLSHKIKIFEVEEIYDTDMISMFHLAGDFNFRSKWQKGVISVEEEEHYLPRVGIKCRYILEDGEKTIQCSSFSYNDELILFTENDDEGNTARFILERIDTEKTKLRIEYYTKHGEEPSGPEANELKSKFMQSLKNLHELTPVYKFPYP